jgi:hydroxymethylbilane synthase
VTARLATHPEVAHRTAEVVDRLVAAGVDVESAGDGADLGLGTSDALKGVRESTHDLALVGIRALRGSAAEDLTTVAVLPRAESRDVLVTISGDPTPLTELAPGARVGLAGARCVAFLRAHRPDLEAVLLDRDVLRRLRVDEALDPSLDVAIMSAIEARQAGFGDRTVESLDPKAWLPEPGQGAIAIVARHPIAEATALDHSPTRTALRTELALLDALDAEDDAPLGCLAQPSGRWIRLWATAVSHDGRRLVRSDRTGPLDEPEALGSAVARELEARGIELVMTGAGK